MTLSYEICDRATTEAANELHQATAALTEARSALRSGWTRRKQEAIGNAQAWVRGARRRLDVWSERTYAAQLPVTASPEGAEE